MRCWSSFDETPLMDGDGVTDGWWAGARKVLLIFSIEGLDGALVLI